MFSPLAHQAALVEHPSVRAILQTAAGHRPRVPGCLPARPLLKVSVVLSAIHSKRIFSHTTPLLCRIDVDEPRRSVGSRQEGGTVRESSDPINDYATAVVKGILRRACLNLVNRPWRLAGVRWVLLPVSTESGG